MDEYNKIIDNQTRLAVNNVWETDMKNIAVVSWRQYASDEPADWYRLDEKDAGNRLFQNLLTNAESDGREILELKFVTEKEWAEADEVGRELA